MQHNTNTNIPPLPKASSGKRAMRSRGQTYPIPGDANMKYPRASTIPLHLQTIIKMYQPLAKISLTSLRLPRGNVQNLPQVTRSAYGVPFDPQVIVMYIWTCAGHLTIYPCQFKNMSPMSILAVGTTANRHALISPCRVDSPPFLLSRTFLRFRPTMTRVEAVYLCNLLMRPYRHISRV